ncbi:hypothetical protein KQR54_28165 [Mycobacterium gordonae]|uniref:hypothetical protein n=1 Tax=Mycobacterium gordonae TaxID=1778 RepID=UPI002109E665|nr:hypothetical protein [Mycobacterium gordonae]MCQ4364954.1 hypothetical protein [Mycobacterium gordonae]
MKAPIIAAAILAVAISAAVVASAEEVPNMTNGVYEGQSCGNPAGKFIFGRDAGGAALICGGNGKPNVWVAAGFPVVGVRQLGETGCVEEIHRRTASGAYAQSPEGDAMICAYPTDTWVIRPTPK